ncbi:MAG: hypothetical protein ABI601_04915, partial [bacterium]
MTSTFAATAVGCVWPSGVATVTGAAAGTGIVVADGTVAGAGGVSGSAILPFDVFTVGLFFDVSIGAVLGWVV